MAVRAVETVGTVAVDGYQCRTSTGGMDTCCTSRLSILEKEMGRGMAMGKKTYNGRPADGWAGHDDRRWIVGVVRRVCILLVRGC